MNEPQTCSHCGAELPPDTPGGHCARCILQFGLQSEAEPLGPHETEPLADPAIPAPPATETLGQFTHYRILEKLGEGGCGIVYRAEQLEPVRREVALKVIKLGMDTRNVIARFEAERQALALMDHPNIAKVLDAGATDTGRPFFVMELVRGVRITDYCERHNLPVRERLKLFVQVCHAVQHAHQKGIIHRDLKPSNVLVTEHDGAPVPKVIDFGVAKATGQQRLTDQTIFTAFEQFIGTPAYMSPEQAGSAGHDVDTRTDIYSLGVLLYELLTGSPPFDPERLRHAGIDEVFRLIREEEPLRPSARLGKEALQNRDATAESTIEASQRLRRIRETVSLLRGDLDCIVTKALEKDRARRYETANGLAADLECFLNDEPVVARAPSPWYRLRKLARRNRAAFLSGAVILSVLVAGLGVTLRLYSREANARRLAQRAERTATTEAAKSRQVANFLENMLQSVQPSVAMGRDTTLLRELLIRTTAQVSIALTNQPEVQGEICWVLGQTYLQISDYKSALALDQRSLGLRRAALGNDSLPVSQSLKAVGDVLCRLKRWHEAEPMLRDALRIQQHALGLTNDTCADTMRLLAESVSGEDRLPEAESIQRRALALSRGLHGGKDQTVAIQLDALANIEMRRHDLSNAETLVRESLRILRPLYPEDSLIFAQPLNDLGNILGERGDQAGAQAALNQAKTIREKWLGKQQPTKSAPMTHAQWMAQAALSSELAVVNEIQDLLQRVAEGESVPAVSDTVHTKTLEILGMLEWRLGKTTEAWDYFNQALSLAKRLPLQGRQRIRTLDTLANFMHVQDHFAEAATLYREDVQARRSDPNNGPADLANTILAVAFDEVNLTNYDRANQMVQEAWNILKAIHTVPPGYETQAIGNDVGALAHMSLLVTNKALSDDYAGKAAELIRRLPLENHAGMLGMNGRDLFMSNLLERLEEKTAPSPAQIRNTSK